jgi:hypothetical protein
MSEQNVPVQRTPIDMKGYARALAKAWRAELGTLPTKGQAGVLWAQYGIETGAGPWCWNNNIGNVKHVPGDGYDYIMLANTWEIINGKKVTFQPPHPATWFRAYPDLDTAMLSHFRFLRGKRYGVAWEGVELEDCGVFARKLKAAGYFTADANDYAKGMYAHHKRWMASDAFEKALAEIAEADAQPANDHAVEPAPFYVDGGILHTTPLPERDDEPPDAA